MIILKKCIIFLSDVTDLSYLLIVKNPNVNQKVEMFLALLMESFSRVGDGVNNCFTREDFTCKSFLQWDSIVLIAN